jgi:hypothetical protein
VTVRVVDLPAVGDASALASPHTELAGRIGATPTIAIRVELGKQRAVRQVAHVFEEARFEHCPMQGCLADRLVVFDRLVIEQAMLAIDHEAPDTVDLPDVALIRFGELSVAHTRKQH